MPASGRSSVDLDVNLEQIITLKCHSEGELGEPHKLLPNKLDDFSPVSRTEPYF